ncbi:hypothetical protein OHA40_02895 [Nocardia sp. NBC_00508]|nr:hypothetical protein [Nocardia sp. NBC_00508]WUD67126.1 hypothetical protein OHA40_02895 [Nocardia sp. NBC_00508]
MSVSASRPQYRARRRRQRGSSDAEGSIRPTVAAWVLVLCVLSIALALL